MTWDYGVFLAMNFDGGQAMDAAMLFASGKLSWVPLYLLILWLAGRRYGWCGAVLALVTIACAVGISDIVAGIFKHTGPLKNLWDTSPLRLRPMHTPELEGLMHIINYGGKYGTFSAHAATSTAIGFIATQIVDRRWFSAVMWIQVALVCYSRIYLAYHFPQDIIFGIALGLGSGYAMWRVFKCGIHLCHSELDSESIRNTSRKLSSGGILNQVQDDTRRDNDRQNKEKPLCKR